MNAIIYLNSKDVQALHTEMKKTRVAAVWALLFSGTLSFILYKKYVKSLKKCDKSA